MNQETIVAIATPPGRGGVGIVRISGSLALSIALKINGNKPLTPRNASYGPFYTVEQEVLDQGLILYFQGPHSFTGEDVIEFQGHGSPWVLDQLVKTCISFGARLAQPGEFSERAFLNDKMDLTQAEAIADLIHASSETAARMAMRSLQGDFSKKIHALNDQSIQLRLYVEAAIDFPEEEIDFLSDGKIERALDRLINDLQHTKSQANQGALLREGISIVIAGKPNVGKSTLINALAGKEVAIVTEIAGTTRDVMREHILLDDIPVHIIDTAGIRDSDDIVEQEGIKRAWTAISHCDCVLTLIDITEVETDFSLSESIKAALPSEVPQLLIFNKIDAVNISPKIENDAIYLSAKSQLGINFLKKKIKETIHFQPAEGQFSARRRHLDALNKAENFLLHGKKQLMEYKAGELLAEDLRLAHQALCTITGEFSADDLLGEIFSSFCIGK